MELKDVERGLANLKDAYGRELDSVVQRATDAKNNLEDQGTVSSDDAFNMSLDCQHLAVLAGKIVQTAAVIRWMKEAK